MSSLGFPEFSEEQLERLDEIEDAAQNFLFTIADSNDLAWCMDDIWELIRHGADIIKAQGRRVQIPTRVTERDGKMYITDWYEEYDNDANVERT